jgi:hypothetical protein
MSSWLLLLLLLKLLLLVSPNTITTQSSRLMDLLLGWPGLQKDEEVSA